MNVNYSLLISLFMMLMAAGPCTKDIEVDTPDYEKAENILFIAVDDLKPLINGYGYEQMITPNFDRLMDMGVSFTNANVQQAVCGPSRASVMTGVGPDRTKVWDLHTDFRESAPELVSMPEYLISEGFETTAVGKIYHKGSSSPGHDGASWSIDHVLPNDFDPEFGTPAFNYYQDEETKRKMDSIIQVAISEGVAKNKHRAYVFERLKPSVESAPVSDYAYQDGLYAKEAIRKMKILKGGDKPWFLGVGFQKPHLPFVAPEKYWKLYDRDEIKPADFREITEGTPNYAFHNFGELRSYSDIPSTMEFGEELDMDKQKELIHGYMACVSYIDAQIGRVLDELERLELEEKTAIVLWGDHGFHLGDHTLWCKHSNFEQATRIPFIFAGPGVEKGQKYSQPVDLVDVFPTLFDLVGVKQSSQAEGQSLMPLLDGNDNTGLEKDYSISQYHRYGGRMGYSMRTERYRYTEWHLNDYRSDQPYDENNLDGLELYDFGNDPNESKNCIDDPAYAAVQAELHEKLKKHLKSKER